MGDVVNINDLLRDQVVMDLSCLDRLYLNAYVPTLQVGGQVVTFMKDHLGLPIPSPAVFKTLGDRFRKAVGDFAQTNAIPLVRFAKGERHIEVMRPYFDRAKGEGVVAIGVAQEFQRVFIGYEHQKTRNPEAIFYGFQKADRRVTVYYFYLLDADFGPAFIKVCSYFPYPAKVWLNGHEWAKAQATKAALAYTALSNGFATCSDPARLQAICDTLGPAKIQAFFEAMVADNLDLGRPEEVRLIFSRQIRTTTRSVFSTRVVTRGTDVTVNVSYKNSRIKEYLKDSRALRVETVVNSPTDLGVARRLPNLPELQAKARAANHRLLEVQRIGQRCAVSSPLLDHLTTPSLVGDQRVSALRFG
ncbi:MAG TPA: hypothetical protein VE152_01425, partial [Acidimicrobiales bacterium]|nr:hypothetical protein [Acidimicrobiales bacterium]